MYEKELITDYTELHKRAEYGFDLPKTVEYVTRRLNEIGVKNEPCGKNGIIGYIGDPKADKCILLRADMDALPIKECSSLPYSATGEFSHACGHDAHTAMLLCAAKILKEEENSLCGCVKLLFQPAEELLEGAKAMIDAGALDKPRVGAAIMLHLITATELESGSVVVSSEGVSAPSADYFRIKINGSACHGSTPEKGRDPISALCRIVTALDIIRARELSLSQAAVITVGTFSAGNAPNVIPEEAAVSGSIRAYSEEVREYIKERISAISSGIATALETESKVEFYAGAPTLLNDGKLSLAVEGWAKALLGKETVKTSDELYEAAKKSGKASQGAGSEDFAYISQRVPSIMVALAAGKASDGYKFPLHNEKTAFDTKSFKYGAALLSECAKMWLNCRK